MWNQQFNIGVARTIEGVVRGVVSIGEEPQNPPIGVSEKRISASKKPATKSQEWRSVDSDNYTINVRDLVRRIKLEERKERNWASARRSNLRCKLKLADVKRELKTSKEKVDALRSKWMALNRENLRLRNSLVTKASQIEDVTL